MIKYLFIIFIAVFLFGCAEEENSTSTPVQETPIQETPIQETPPVQEAPSTQTVKVQDCNSNYGQAVIGCSKYL